MKKQISLVHAKNGLRVAAFLLFLLPCVSWASAPEDLEKPKPAFTRAGDIITAKLIPRAKSNSVTIDFQMAGDGTLTAVNAFDIYKALSPQINVKDFRSDLFHIDIDGVVPGGEVTLSVSSAFFTSSTSFWVFNEHLPTPWMDSKAENIPLGEKVYKFVVRIQDGGQFDSDGAANGRITMIAGPSDSFWGYVLGTLFIRFFGVFIVLGVLMIGMLLSGQIFQFLEKKSKMPKPATPEATEPPKAKPPAPVYDLPPSKPLDAVTPEMAAAIGAALAMHLAARKMPATATAPAYEAVQTAPSWAVDGRRQIMSDRSMVFNRVK
jgi:hypothetical protein